MKGSDPRGFADALRKLAADAPARALAGEAGRLRWEETYGLERMVGAIWMVYQRVLARVRHADARISAS
ncbi:MAG TPA: hypothetical protein DD502_23080 [Cupriavidus sp.]|nr:hypothetical protein [Cupriavidus sp.]